MHDEATNEPSEQVKSDEERAKEYAKTHPTGASETSTVLLLLAGGAVIAALAVCALLWLLPKLPFN